MEGKKNCVKGPLKVIFLRKVKRLMQLCYDFLTDASGQVLCCEVASLLESAYFNLAAMSLKIKSQIDLLWFIKIVVKIDYF